MAQDPARLPALRARLEQRAAELKRELGEELRSAEGHDAPGLPNRRDETDDEAAAEAQSALDLAATQRDARELSEVVQALERIRAGDYGQCIDCDAEIPLARLEVQPQAARCVACEEAFERRSRR